MQSALLEFDQLARILNYLWENRAEKRIKRVLIQEDTGFAERQVETLVSMGAAMGIIKPGNQTLTETGFLLAEYDIFIENRASLEWCHYIGSSTYKNLFWYEVFNDLLQDSNALQQNEWNDYFRAKLSEQYTKRTIGKALYEEVRFIIDAYTEQNFKKLELLNITTDKRIFRRRYLQFTPLILTAMIYDFCEKRKTNLYQIEELAMTPGSPAVVFGVDSVTFRQEIEKLHDLGWLRYETTHGLDQIRLKPGYTSLEFLKSFYEDRDPKVTEPGKSVLGELF